MRPAAASSRTEYSALNKDPVAAVHVESLFFAACITPSRKHAGPSCWCSGKQRAWDVGGPSSPFPCTISSQYQPSCPGRAWAAGSKMSGESFLLIDFPRLLVMGDLSEAGVKLGRREHRCGWGGGSLERACRGFEVPGGPHPWPVFQLGCKSDHRSDNCRVEEQSRLLPALQHEGKRNRAPRQDRDPRRR